MGLSAVGEKRVKGPFWKKRNESKGHTLIPWFRKENEKEQSIQSDDPLLFHFHISITQRLPALRPPMPYYIRLLLISVLIQFTVTDAVLLPPANFHSNPVRRRHRRFQFPGPPPSDRHATLCLFSIWPSPESRLPRHQGISYCCSLDVVQHWCIFFSIMCYHVV